MRHAATAHTPDPMVCSAALLALVPAREHIGQVGMHAKHAIDHHLHQRAHRINLLGVVIRLIWHGSNGNVHVLHAMPNIHVAHH